MSQGITCVSGCTTREHKTDCPGDCNGCLPAIAHHGALCARCHGRLETILSEQPKPGLTLTAWMLTHVAVPISRGELDPDSKGMGKGQRKAEDGTPAPIRPAVMDWLDDWRVSLAGWVDVFCDHAGMTGPSRVDAEVLRDYLGVHIASIECADYVTELIRELGDLVSRAHALAPWRQPAAKPQAIPCKCEVKRNMDRENPPELTLHIDPDHNGYQCSRCANRYTVEGYKTWAGLVWAAGKRLEAREKAARKKAVEDARKAARAVREAARETVAA